MLLLNGGDNFQGSLFYTTYKGKVEAEFLNQMKFDAMTVGNHEFDDGEDALAPFLDDDQVPGALAPTWQPAPRPRSATASSPPWCIEVGGQKIGIIGAVTTDTPEIASPGPNILILNDIASIKAEVDKLKAEGVNKIIALTHVGYPRDKEMIAKIPGVDVVVGGHSHSLLSNTDEKAEGPYPTMIDNPDGYKVPVTQAASYSKYLGEFKVVFDDNGVVKEASGDPDPARQVDQARRGRARPHQGTRRADRGTEEQGKSAKAPTPSTAAATIAAPANAPWATSSPMPCSTASRDRASRSSSPMAAACAPRSTRAPVTMGEVLTVLPFQNTVATFQISGTDLVAALENGVSQLEEGGGRFAQVAGLKYSFDKSVAPNAGRIKSVEVMDGDAWMPIDPAKDYLVATNNYVRQGGDGYKIFATKAKNAYDYGPGLEQVVADYLSTPTALHAEARRPHHRDRRGRRHRTMRRARRGSREAAAAVP